MNDPSAPPPFGAPPYPSDAPADRAGTIPALWTRLVARLFDELILAVPRLALSLPYLTIVDDKTIEMDLPKWAVVLTVVVPMVYEFVFLAWRGATPGKSLFGIAVRNASDTGRIVPYQAGLRVVVPALGAALALAMPSADTAALFQLITPIVYASVLWDPRRRGWHDKAAGTIVLRTR